MRDETSGDKYGALFSRRRIIAGEKEKRLYMTRYYLLPTNQRLNVYLHVWYSSDDYEKALHNHPWASLSLLFRGVMEEHLWGGKIGWGKKRRLVAPVWTRREANTYHAIELPPQKTRPLSLFITGRVVQSWKFKCLKDGTEHPWRDYQRRDSALCD